MEFWAGVKKENVTENTSQNAQPRKYMELALKFLERNVPTGFGAEQFVRAECIPVFSWSFAQQTQVIHI